MQVDSTDFLPQPEPFKTSLTQEQLDAIKRAKDRHNKAFKEYYGEDSNINN